MTAIGIDLGTSNCCVYAVKDGALALIPSATGTATTPSWVAFTDDDVLVGDAARRQAVTNPENTIFNAKRLLGRKFYAPEITWLREALPVGLVPAPNGDAWVRLGGTDRSPQEILSYLFEHLRGVAEDYLEEPVDRAVVTIPGFADDRQRQATIDAARLAGLRIERLIHSPTAAALAHAHQSNTPPGRWAVLELGGGCFDASIIHVHGPRTLEVASTVGDLLLGGDDFDRRIVDHLVDNFHEKHGVDLAQSPTAVQRLYEAARTAKHEISLAPRSSTIHLPLIAQVDGQSLTLYEEGIERATFEHLAAEEVEGLGDPCAWALEDVGLGTDDMTDLLLLGGMTRMPAVQQTIAYLFRARPRRFTNIEQLGAMGAAICAGAMTGAFPPVELREITPHSLGLKGRGGAMSPVIPRRAAVPCRERRVFSAARTDQRHVVFELFQGEAELVNDNVYIGRFVLENLGPAEKVGVDFAIDPNGGVAISAIDASGAERPGLLQLSSGLTRDEIRALASGRAERSRNLAPPANAPRFVTTPPPSAQRSRRPPPQRRSAMPPAPPTTKEKVRELPRHSQPPPGATTKPAVRKAAGTESDQPMQVADDSLVGTVLGGRYVIEDIVAEGGMGRVYLARHDVLNKKFAIKVLHAELASNEDLAGRFVREAQAAATIGSQHVVDISDFGRLPDGTGYFVMEYLEGQTLAQLIERGPLPADLIVSIALQLTSGLAAAHDKGIVHRDLKPDNVTLIRRGGNPYFCKILDFGIAKAPTSDSDKSRTLAGTLLGTPHYMAPEQIDGSDVDARSDIYALGAVMYEMATGRTPFEADTIVGVLVKHKTERPLPVRAHAAHCPAALETLILKCLEKSPEQRYQSAEELHDALREL